MSRIEIICSEKDMERILEIFQDNCPFNPYTEECGEDARCSECVERHINFDITDSK